MSAPWRGCGGARGGGVLGNVDALVGPMTGGGSFLAAHAKLAPPLDAPHPSLAGDGAGIRGMGVRLVARPQRVRPLLQTAGNGWRGKKLGRR